MNSSKIRCSLIKYKSKHKNPKTGDRIAREQPFEITFYAVNPYLVENEVYIPIPRWSHTKIGNILHWMKRHELPCREKVWGIPGLKCWWAGGINCTAHQFLRLKTFLSQGQIFRKIISDHLFPPTPETACTSQQVLSDSTFNTVHPVRALHTG